MMFVVFVTSIATYIDNDGGCGIISIVYLNKMIGARKSNFLKYLI